MITLDQLLSDVTRGATPILRDSLHCFLSLPDDRIVTETYEGVKKLKDHFNAMGVFHHLGETIHGIRKSNTLRSALKELLSSLDVNKQAITKIGSRLLPESVTILTISCSSMVRDVILAGHKSEKQINVLCLRSAPENEGELLAGFLQNSGIKAEIIEDDSFHEKMNEVDLILLGCDLISDGFFINKQGSGDLVKAAKTTNTPVWIVTDTLRMVLEFDINQTINPIFEIVPFIEQIQILCEEGLLIYKELVALCADKKSEISDK